MIHGRADGRWRYQITDIDRMLTSRSIRSNLMVCGVPAARSTSHASIIGLIVVDEGQHGRAFTRAHQIIG